MADKKKMSVAEILAAARKSDGSGESNPPAEATAASEASQKSAPISAKPAVSKPEPQAASGGGRPSVSDILAMARQGKSEDASTPASKAPSPAAKPKPAAAKPSAKPAAAKSAPAKGAPAARDTASILAAARKSAKPGPVSKAEAAQAGVAPKPAAKTKEKASVPPMPAKPAYAQPKPAKSATDEDRRGVMAYLFGSMLGIGFTSLSATGGLWTLGAARFFFPNILTEPPTTFKVGFPGDYASGQVQTKFKAQFGVWVVNWEYEGQQQIYALSTVCTHLGCTPNWLEAEQKFKCPCHGSGFYKDGINFEGPAPRPLERYAISIADDGQLEVDKSKKFQEEMGQWADPASFVLV